MFLSIIYAKIFSLFQIQIKRIEELLKLTTLFLLINYQPFECSDILTSLKNNTLKYVSIENIETLKNNIVLKEIEQMFHV